MKTTTKKQTTTFPIITADILKEWNACSNGFRRFCELFPEGAELKTAAEGLDADGHYEWAIWLYENCRKDERFKVQAALGFKNAGHRNAGHRNAGHRNAGHWNAGHWNAGHSNAGHRNAGHSNAGHWNAGHSNAGDSNAGHRNAGHWNAGHWNAGHWNAGHSNAGHRNAGHWNAGDRNAGHSNAGHRNAGHSNAGHWNAGDRNAGHFNTICPNKITIFNKPCSYAVWDKSAKPDFIFHVDPIRWISESQMTDAEKIAQPKFYVMGGYTKRIAFKEAWAEAWKSANAEDKELLLKLPNFDAAVFLEISGIDVND